MNGFELYLLGRRLTRIGEDAIPALGFHDQPTSYRLILVDVLEHPDSSISDITERTGFPQSLVSSAVATLREGGAVLTTTDPADRRRTLVRPAPRPVSRHASAPIGGPLGAALGNTDPAVLAEVTAALDTLADHLLGDLRPRHTADFEDYYRPGGRTPAWDIGRPQGAFVALAEAGALTGQVLDVGCGTGEHALLAAGRGLAATGVDAAPAAIDLAVAKAQSRGLAARFLVADALELGGLGQRFDTVLDCGLFHVFDDHDRPRYVRGLAEVMPSGGRYFMLCFSDRQPGTLGPRRLTEAEIRDSFAAGWRVDSIEPAVIEITTNPAGAQAWLASITRQ